VVVSNVVVALPVSLLQHFQVLLVQVLFGGFKSSVFLMVMVDGLLHLFQDLIALLLLQLFLGQLLLFPSLVGQANLATYECFVVGRCEALRGVHLEVFALVVLSNQFPLLLVAETIKRCLVVLSFMLRCKLLRFANPQIEGLLLEPLPFLNLVEEALAQLEHLLVLGESIFFVFLLFADDVLKSHHIPHRDVARPHQGVVPLLGTRFKPKSRIGAHYFLREIVAALLNVASQIMLLAVDQGLRRRDLGR